MSEDTSKSSSNGLIYLILIMLLLGGLAFVAYKWSDTKTLNEDCANQNALLESELKDMEQMMSGYVGEMSDDMRKDLKAMLQTYDDLIEKDSSKSDSLNAQKAEILDLMNQLDKNKRLSARELSKLRKENETLKGIMRGYVRQIDSLYTMNKRLEIDLDETSTKLNETSTERDNYKKEAEEKGEQVKKGSKLRAYNINSGALKMKTNNTTEATDRAKKVYQLKSSFTLQENVLAIAGRKTVYMSITAPNGQVLQSRSSNIVSTDLGSIAYSDKKDVDYNNQALDVTIYYDVNSDAIDKGTYRVKLYCEGVLIGEDSFVLK
ncbi:MAG: hypothetical protein FJX99_05780 [Bacteroidetes bacterium]|nr:hypothetical protein [Bacteroidota bacterium]